MRLVENAVNHCLSIPSPISLSALFRVGYVLPLQRRVYNYLGWKALPHYKSSASAVPSFCHLLTKCPL